MAIVAPLDNGQLARARARRVWLAEQLSSAIGRGVRVELREPEATTAAETEPNLDDAAMRRQAEEDPVVKRAMELFDARVVRIESVGRQTPEQGEQDDV